MRPSYIIIHPNYFNMTMYKSLLILLFSCSFCSISAENLADSVFVESDIVYRILNDTTVAVARQDAADGYTLSLKDSILVIPSQVKHSGKSYQVKRIEKGAFFKICSIKEVDISNGIDEISELAFIACANLEVVRIPASIKEIGEDAFAYCISLRSIRVDKSNIIFDSRDDCNAIIEKYGNELICGCKSTRIPSSVERINSRAFVGCMIDKIIIPEGVKDICQEAFYYCNNLKEIYISSTVEFIHYNAFSYCSNIETITVNPKNKTFDSRNECNAIINTEDTLLVLGCSNTKIPSGIKEIGEGAFMNCKNLREIIIPEGVEYIGSEAFYGCSALRRVQLPTSLVCFDRHSHFSHCTSLDSIFIPQNVDSIPSDIFVDCHSLAKIVVDKRNQKYDSRQDCNCVIRTSDNVLVAGCKGSVIVDGVKSISAYSFDKSGITSIHIPASVVKIDSAAFRHNEYCMAISVDSNNSHYKSDGTNSIMERGTNKLVLACATTQISPEVSSIGAYAFTNSSDLVVIPSGVRSIGHAAFGECKDLFTVIIPPSVERIERSAFGYCKQLTNVIMRGTPAFIHERAFDGCDNLKDCPYSNAK